MEGRLNLVADGRARGLTLWYTLAHLATCPYCRRFLDSLKTLLARLHQVRQSEPNEVVVARIVEQYRSAQARE
jgi:predicted anti-sigma-YlaC factor YlaD